MFPSFNNVDREQRDAELRQMNMIREQAGLQSAEMLNDQILMQQQEEKTDLLKWQQSLQDELDLLKHKLRSETYDSDKNKWIKTKIAIGYDKNGRIVEQDLPPLMNEIGISKVETIISPLLSRNLINSNLSEDMILGILKRTSNDLVSNIAYYGEDLYDIEFGNFSTVIRLIKNTMIPTPFRAMSGWNKKIDSTISKRVESYNEGASRLPERKKIFGLF